MHFVVWKEMQDTDTRVRSEKAQGKKGAEQKRTEEYMLCPKMASAALSPSIYGQ